MSNDSTALKVTGAVSSAYAEILSEQALAFITALADEFSPRVAQLLELRDQRQQDIDGGRMPDFLPETRDIRESDWKVCSIPDDLKDRRVEITGPTERKMIINALNSGAKVFMAEAEGGGAKAGGSHCEAGPTSSPRVRDLDRYCIGKVCYIEGNLLFGVGATCCKDTVVGYPTSTILRYFR